MIQFISKYESSVLVNKQKNIEILKSCCSLSSITSLEKARQASNTINSLKDANGESHDSDHAVLNIAKSFYEKMYTAKPSSYSTLNAYFSSLPRERVLGNDSQLKCEGLVSYPECMQSLNKMKKNKSPGLDGITTEYYQEFWPLIGNLLCLISIT